MILNPRVRQQLDAAVAAGAKAAAEHVLDRSNQLVPRESGDLERSGAVDAGKGYAEIVYNSPYAKFQHENLRLHHPHGRHGKFLEVAAVEEREKVREIIADHVRRVTR